MQQAEISRIYVLNVKKFSQRRAFMEQQLAIRNLHAEFIFDWDVEDLNEQILSQYFRDGNTLSPAQQSCALKHIAALQKVSTKDGFALILEDDAILGADFETGLRRAMEESRQFLGNKVIFIGSGGNFFTPQSQRKPGQYLYIGNRGRFADSYILDGSTAQKRLEWIEKYKISKPIDNQFEEIDKEKQIATLWLEDPIVEQGSKNGRFDSALEAAPPLWLKAILFRWEKLRRKYIYQLWR